MSTEKLYDLDFVYEISKGNVDFVRSLCDVYISNTPPIVNDMSTALATEDWDAIGKLAHKLKSTIDTMGLASIKEDIRFLELSAKNKVNLEQLPDAINKVRTIVLTSVEQLKEELTTLK